MYKYHPILENLKVNEDGTSILYDGEVIEPKTYARKGNIVPMEVVTIGKKSVTVMRLVCECWHGISENREYLARRIDPANGNHYANLCWARQGSQSPKTQPKYSRTEFEKLQNEIEPNESVRSFLIRRKISEKTYYAAKKRYEQEE